MRAPADSCHVGAVRPDLNRQVGANVWCGGRWVRLAGQAQEAAGVDGLAGVLGGVVND